MNRYSQIDSYAFYDEIRDQKISTLPIRLIDRSIKKFLLHKISSGDRIDILAEKYYGDSKKYWLIMDYNDLLCPFDLENYIGDYLRIPDPFEVNIR